MTTRIEPWRRRIRSVLATLVVAALATTICQHCLDSAAAQSGGGDEPPTQEPCAAGPET